MRTAIGPGTSFPLGATMRPHGVNFSVFSKSSTGVDLLLFNAVHDAQPARVLALDPGKHRTAHYWHAYVPDLQPGQIYAYRVRGAFDPHRGLRFDPDKVLLDPYGKAVAVPRHYSRQAARQPGDTTATAMKSVVADPSRYDWEGDTPLQRSYAHTVIYEMHVGGFTRHPSSGLPLATRGTYAGVIAKIPYLQDLGVTAVELLPVFQFDAQDGPPGLVNYWATVRCRSSPPTTRTVPARTPSGLWTSFGTWSRRCIAPASRSSSMWCSTIRPKAITRVRPSVFGGSKIRRTTSSTRIRRVTQIIAAPGTP